MPEEQNVWNHCSPWLLQTGVDCATTPRESCFCPLDGSHDHLVSREIAEHAIDMHNLNFDGVVPRTHYDEDSL